MKMSCNNHIRIHSALLVAAGLLTGASATVADINLRMQTDLGAVDLALFDGPTEAPDTVSNFMAYVNNGDFDGTLVHRASEYTDPDPLTQLFPAGTPFVIQTGGFFLDPPPPGIFNGGLQSIPDITPVAQLPGEVGLPNTRGSLAMALSGNPPDQDSATNQWFVNLSDNAILDPNFTVFGEVNANDMSVIDDIHAVGLMFKCAQASPTCAQLFPQLAEMPIVLDSTSLFPAIDSDLLVEILAIGADNDGDGAVDSQESPTAVSMQNIVSYPDENGGTVTITSPVASPIQDFNRVNSTFALWSVPTAVPTNDLANVFIGQRAFEHGFAGYTLNPSAPGGSVDVVITLSSGSQPDTFYNFGPEPGITTPHWYEFSFDGTTGAMYNTPGPDQITLRFLDGARGDDDLDNGNGIIVAAVGGALNGLIDIDGVSAATEDAGPNGGNGNSDNDSILDSLQGNVVTLPDLLGNYITLEATLPQSFYQVSVSRQSGNLTTNTPGINLLANHNFKHGFIQAFIYNVAPGGAAQFTIRLPAGETADTYFMFGPEPGNPTPHWYEFMFDPVTGTGAVIDNANSRITLHFVDGERGDADLDATNGVIMDPGGPAQFIANANAQGGGGGCSVANQRVPASHAGAWMLLLLGLVLHRIGRR